MKKAIYYYLGLHYAARRNANNFISPWHQACNNFTISVSTVLLISILIALRILGIIIPPIILILAYGALIFLVSRLLYKNEDLKKNIIENYSFQKPQGKVINLILFAETVMLIFVLVEVYGL